MEVLELFVAAWALVCGDDGSERVRDFVLMVVMCFHFGSGVKGLCASWILALDVLVSPMWRVSCGALVLGMVSEDLGKRRFGLELEPSDELGECLWL